MAVKYSEESLKKLSEPDRLDAYIRVASPGMWSVVVAVGLTIVALVLWASLGEVDGVTLASAIFG